MRKRLTKMTLEQRAPRNGRLDIRDTESPLVLRITDKGHKSFVVRTRLKGQTGAPLRFTFPKTVRIENLSAARQWAFGIVDQCREGIDPRGAKQAQAAAAAEEAQRAERMKCSAVFNAYVERRLRREKNNRTADETQRIFEIYVLPRWGNRSVTEIDREEVNALLNDIFDRKIVGPDGKQFGGNVAADRVLAQVRACFNWYALQDSKFTSPIVPGMARTNPRKRIRSRILSDDEIRAAWTVLPAQGLFGAAVKTLLLSAQRREEVAGMKRSEITATGLWTIPAERYKTGKPQTVPLSKTALAVIRDQDQIDDSDLIFTTNGETPYSGFGKSKDRLDTAMLQELQKQAQTRGEDPLTVILPEWRLHDLRRTAKTLMVRAGVRPDISERVLGHVIPGIEGVYDHYDYIPEKREALEALAAIVNRIVTATAADAAAMKEAAE